MTSCTTIRTQKLLLDHEDKYHEDLANGREGDCCMTSHVPYSIANVKPVLRDRRVQASREDTKHPDCALI